MPTPLQRIQICCEPELYAAVKTIAKGRNMTASATAAALLTQILSTPELREEYNQTALEYGAVPVPEDTRRKPRQQPHFKVSHPVEGEGVVSKGVREGKSYMELAAQKWDVENDEDFVIPDNVKKALMKKLMEELL